MLGTKLTILNYKDLHFNLVVEKYSMIAKYGTFSFQRKVAGNTKPKTTSGIGDLQMKVEALTVALAKS